jgi:hypothetical protein
MPPKRTHAHIIQGTKSRLQRTGFTFLPQRFTALAHRCINKINYHREALIPDLYKECSRLCFKFKGVCMPPASRVKKIWTIPPPPIFSPQKRWPLIRARILHFKLLGDASYAVQIHAWIRYSIPKWWHQRIVTWNIPGWLQLYAIKRFNFFRNLPRAREMWNNMHTWKHHRNQMFYEWALTWSLLSVDYVRRHNYIRPNLLTTPQLNTMPKSETSPYFDVMLIRFLHFTVEMTTTHNYIRPNLLTTRQWNIMTNVKQVHNHVMLIRFLQFNVVMARTKCLLNLSKTLTEDFRLC